MNGCQMLNSCTSLPPPPATSGGSQPYHCYLHSLASPETDKCHCQSVHSLSWSRHKSTHHLISSSFLHFCCIPTKRPARQPLGVCTGKWGFGGRERHRQTGVHTAASVLSPRAPTGRVWRPPGEPHRLSCLLWGCSPQTPHRSEPAALR